MLPPRPDRAARLVLLILLIVVLVACEATAPAERAGDRSSAEPEWVEPAWTEDGRPAWAAPPAHTGDRVASAQSTLTPGAPTAALTTLSVEVVWQTDGAPHRLRFPTGLAVDGRGSVYVVDAGHNRIQALTSAGQPATRWGGSGSAPGQFIFQGPAAMPSDSQPLFGGSVAVDGQGHVYVADPLNARIQKFDRDGRFVTAWGGVLQDDGIGRMSAWAYSYHDDNHPSRPLGVAVDQQGQVYVADSGHHVQQFDASGALLRAWGGPGVAAGQFASPTAIAVDAQGQVYVADSGNYRIQKFDRAGRFLTMWGGYGDQAGEFAGPLFLAVDAAGRVYASDGRNHRVQVFDGVGNLLGQWGGPGSAPGQFGYAGGIAVDAQGDIIVADMAHNHIQKFRVRGSWPSALPGTPTPRPLPPTPLPTPRPLLTPTDR